MKYLYLFICILVGGFFTRHLFEPKVVTPIKVAAPTPTPEIPTPILKTPQIEMSSNLLTLTNQYRESLGLKDLTETAVLDQSAQTKCNDMEARNYWEHSINGESFHQFDPPALTWGENLAKGYSTDSQVMEAWKASPTHNKNLIDPLFTTVGFAYCNGPIQNLVVQELELAL